MTRSGPGVIVRARNVARRCLPGLEGSTSLLRRSHFLEGTVEETRRRSGVIRVLVVGDIRLYREGLAASLDREDGIAVVGSASDRRNAVAEGRRLRPDVALIDLAMPESHAAVRSLAAIDDLHVVALAVPEQESEIVSCAEAGIAGYVTRDGSFDDLVAMIQSVARGETLLSPRIAATLMRRVAALAADRRRPPADAPLTARELEIVALIDEGLSNKAIAQQLSIELATVKNHVHNILEKLRVTRRGEAAAQVRRTRVDAGVVAESAE